MFPSHLSLLPRESAAPSRIDLNDDTILSLSSGRIAILVMWTSHLSSFVTGGQPKASECSCRAACTSPAPSSRCSFAIFACNRQCVCVRFDREGRCNPKSMTMVPPSMRMSLGINRLYCTAFGKARLLMFPLASSFYFSIFERFYGVCKINVSSLQK